MKKIYVRVADAATGQVALWERHPEHPDGEVFLSCLLYTSRCV